MSADAILAYGIVAPADDEFYCEELDPAVAAELEKMGLVYDFYGTVFSPSPMLYVKESATATDHTAVAGVSALEAGDEQADRTRRWNFLLNGGVALLSSVTVTGYVDGKQVERRASDSFRDQKPRLFLACAIRDLESAGAPPPLLAPPLGIRAPEVPMADEKQTSGVALDLNKLREVAKKAAEQERERQRREHPARLWIDETEAQDAALLAVANYTLDLVRETQK